MSIASAVFKKIASIFLRISISIVLLIFLFQQVDIKSLLQIIKNANKWYLCIGFFILLFNYLFCLFRWQMLLKAAQINIPLKRTAGSFAGGIFFNLFLPSTIGGDFIRSLDMTVYTQKPSEVLATVFLDRLSGYIAMVVIAISALFLGWGLIRDNSILLAIGLLTALLVAILLVLFNKYIYSKINHFLETPNAGKIRELLKNINQEVHLFRGHKKTIVINLILSLFIQAISPLVAYFISLSFGLKIDFIYFFIFVPIIGAITMLPISVGGLGLRDSAMVFFFAKIGVGKDIAFAMSLLSFFFILIYGSIGGLIYVLTVHHRRIQRHSPL